MRSVGSVQRASGFGAQDHLSWPYDDRADFCERVREFLSDGFDLGLRCVYAAEGPLEQLESDLAEIPDIENHIGRGALVINVLSELYPEGAAIDPRTTLATFADATEEALAHGFAGLRVAADSTPLVRSPEQLAAFAEWEHLADRYMVEHPFSGLCAFDPSQLPETTTVALACLHPVAREGATPFCVYASGNGAHLALAGELDIAVTDEFRACLDRTGPDVTRELIVDGTRLEYVDHRALEAVRDYASGFGATAVFLTCSSLPGRLIELLRLDGIRAVSRAAEGTA